MKTAFKYTVLALACWSLVSCNPDWLNPDENDYTPSEENVFWNVVGQLVDDGDITPDYKGKTFTANIGSPDNGDESVRVVSVNSLTAAVDRFNNLAGTDITETTSTKEWKNASVGSLTWHLTGDNTSWAIVDVNIPSVPGLHKIIYRSPEQGDTNGSVGNNGSAYYRFGDVIERTREDLLTEYWICVRPSFGPEGKGDSHWISVSKLPDEKIWPYNSTKPEQKGKPHEASNKMHYGLPTLIGSDVEWHQDLAEMLFAIMYPEEWYNNAWNFYSTNFLGMIDGLRIFNDFSDDNLKYHNEAFWTNVQKQWKEKNLVLKLFGVTYDEMAAALNPNNANAQGLYLLYNGYSWNTSTSNKPKLYQLHYTNGEGDKEKNMHKQTKTTVSAQVVVPRNLTESNTNFPLDVHNINQHMPYLTEARFFGDDKPRWIVRYATGEELSNNDRYDPQQPIPGFTKNNEVYRYYKDVFPEKNLTDAPEITDEKGTDGYVGRAHYRWGNVYKDEKGCKWFVFNQSGFDSNLNNPALDERSRYSELISFDTSGFELYTPAGKDAPSKVSNLPSLEIVLRVYPFLMNLSMQTVGKTDAEIQDHESFGMTAWNILQSAGVDMRKLIQFVMAQNKDVRASSGLCCIAYNAPGDKQALARCIINTQQPGYQINLYTWSKYPLNPDTQTQFVQNFRPRTIYLQDIADQQSVNDLAADTYAVQPLSRMSLASSDMVTLRPVRTQADPRANDVRNYFYDQQAFANVQYPGSMWNEPILFFRYTRVKDMGDYDYSETTVDGHKLTLFQERVWSTYNVPDRDACYDHIQNYPMVMWQTLNGDMYLNGEQYNVIRWRDIKDSEL